MFFQKKKVKIINIEGMTCDHCAQKLKNALENLTDVSKAKIDLTKKTALVTYENTLDEILLQNTIESLGYKVAGIKEKS